MIISPSDNSTARLLIADSAGSPEGTISQIERGGVRLLTSSARDADPEAPCATSASTASLTGS